MENNTPHDELLIEYLASDILAEDKAIVEKWISANEANRSYFESLQGAWQLSGHEKALSYVLDEIDVDAKWAGIKRAIDEKELKPATIQKQIVDDSENASQPLNGKSKVYRLFVRAGIAASVLLIIGLGWKFLANNNQNIPVAHHGEKKPDSLAFVIRHEVNITGMEKKVQLPDGTIIVLADKSEITYREPFTNTRDITLLGKAFFNVAKDKAKPFTVISSNISTTAIGTKFTVTAFRMNKQIIVRLYEGKVVIKSATGSNNKLKNDVYLLPGQSFTYSATTSRVKEFKMSGSNVPEQVIKQEMPLDNPSLSDDSPSPYFMFNNQPLGDVLDNLAALYNVTIVYDRKDVQDLYFIGKYNTSDSLETILKRIATLNYLKVSRKDTAYIIGK